MKKEKTIYTLGGTAEDILVIITKEIAQLNARSLTWEAFTVIQLVRHDEFCISWMIFIV